MNRSFPEDGEMASFEGLAEPLAKVLRSQYRKKSKPKPISYEGYDLPKGSPLIVGAYNISERFEPENLKFDLEDQGRDLADTIIGAAISLGMEQGIRYAAYQRKHSDAQFVKRMVESILDQYEFEDQDGEILREYLSWLR